MVEVGQVPIAVTRAQHPGRDAALGPDVRTELNCAVGPERLGPPLELGLYVAELGVVGRVEHGDRPAEEPRKRCGAGTGRVGRPGERREEPAPLDGRCRLQDAVAPGHHGGDASPAQRRLDRFGFGVLADQHCEVAGSQAAPRGAVTPGGDPGRLQQLLDLIREVAGDRGLGGGADDLVVLGPGKVVAEREPYPQSRYRGAVVRRETQVLVPGRRLDRQEFDPGVAERRALEEMSEGLEQRPVGTPVRSEREPRRAGLVRGLEVGVHVRAAERVDRLLGVGDQDEGRIVTGTSEQSREDLPLHRVGVLELVDERDAETAAQSGKGVRALDQRVTEPGQHVVERERASNTSPPMDLRDSAVEEATQSSGGRRRLGVVDARDDAYAGVPEHLDRKAREGLQAREVARGRRIRDRLRREHVGADRVDEFVGVVEERRVEVAGSCRAQGGEHLLREAVDGRDRGRVEVGDCPLEALESQLTVGAGHEGQELVGGCGVARAAERGRNLAEPGPDTVAQLGRGGSGESDYEQLLDGNRFLRHVAHDEARERVGLAGAGARLDRDAAGGQRVEEREDRRCAHLPSSVLASIAPHR